MIKNRMVKPMKRQLADKILPITLIALFVGFSASSASAQSLKANAPAPLKAGVNRGLVDALVGAHYWTFMAQPGNSKVHVTYSAMGIYGTAPRTTVTFTMSDAANTWHTSKVLTSQGSPVDTSFEGVVKTPTKIVISVVPPTNALLRVGGNYEIEVTGAVAFDQTGSTASPVIGMYKQMAGYTKPLGDCKFTADGKVVTTNGATGDWKLFDENDQIYVVNIDGEERQSLKYVPGRGLVSNDIIIYQMLK